MSARTVRPAIGTAWLPLAAACGSDGGAAAGSKPFVEAQELLAADRVFAGTSAERGAGAWAQVWAESGLLYREGGASAVGPREVRAAVAPIVSRLRWEPTSAAMLWPDSLGYTVGRWWMAPEDSGRGAEAARASADTSRYLTVWQRAGAEWKVALDLLLPVDERVEGAHEFDFWIGDWTLDQRMWTGEGDVFEPFEARSRVRAAEGGGALVESFDGHVRFFWAGMDRPVRIRGASVRVYEPEAGEWRIFWIDTLDPKFGPPFRGGFAGGTGEFLLADRPGGGRPARIRFVPRDGGTVDWDLAVRARDGVGWQLLWTIEFRRSEAG